MDLGLLSGIAAGLNSGIQSYNSESRYRQEREDKNLDRKLKQEAHKADLLTKGFSVDESGKFSQSESSRRKQQIQDFKDGLKYKTELLRTYGADAVGMPEGRQLQDEIRKDSQRLQSLMDQEYSQAPQAQPMSQNTEESPVGLLAPQAPRGLISAPQKSEEMDGVGGQSGKQVSFGENTQYPGFVSGYEPKYIRKAKAVADINEEARIRAETRSEERKRQHELENPTEQKSNAAGFAKRIEDAEQVFNNLESSGYNRAATGSAASAGLSETPVLGSLAKSAGLIDEKTLMQDQAERNFVNAVLRRESGAAISSGEFDNAEKQYFPRVGDTPAVIEQKRQNRLDAQASLKTAAGEKLFAKVGKEAAKLKAGKNPQGLIKQGEPKQIKISNGKETLLVSPQDAAEAAKEGFKVVQ